MEQKLFHRQSGKLLGVIAEHMPSHLTSDRMQYLIGHPKELEERIGIALSDWSTLPKHILRRVSNGQVLEATDAQQTLSSSGLFWDFNDKQQCKGWGENVFKNVTTERTCVQMHQLHPNAKANVNTMFNSLNPDIEEMCLTQHQIVDYIKKYPNDILGSNCSTDRVRGTYFLCDAYLKKFVIRVMRKDYKSFSARVEPFGDQFCVFFGKDDVVRLVIPKFSHRMQLPAIF